MERFRISSEFKDAEWLNGIISKLKTKMSYGTKCAQKVDYIPYTSDSNGWKPNKIGWWTNGFWPSAMWQMYLMSGDELFRLEALRTEKMLDEALKNFKSLDHDVGFMWLIHSGVRYALEKNQDSFDRTLFAANTLMSRFNPSGFIRAWNNEGRQGWAIIDTMMNLPLLYWASRQTGDPRYKKTAMIHADTAMKYFLREDGSSNHIVIFDAESGEYLENPAGQGCASGSCWSRGQAWALYGFTLSYMCTGKAEYLNAAKRVANFFISRITDDWIPRCDFSQLSNEYYSEREFKDNAAGNIAACGLIELAKCLSAVEGSMYFEAAVKILKAQEATCANWNNDNPAIFTKCASAWNEHGAQMTMNYADCFFIEAVNKLRGEEMLAWIP